MAPASLTSSPRALPLEPAVGIEPSDVTSGSVMQLFMMKSKLHRATVTAANLHYVGSITVDRLLMDAVGILENEKVQVVDVSNGQRLETYALAGPAGDGDICLNGAAARLVQPGDKVIIMAYALVTEEEARTHRPRVALLDGKNRLERMLEEGPRQQV